MDELIAKELAGEASDLDRRQLAGWRRGDARNEETYRVARFVWWATGVEEAEVSPAPRVEIITAAADRRRRRARGWDRGRNAIWSPWMGYGLATAAIVALGFLTLRGERDDGVTLLAPLRSSPSAEGPVTMSLSDGSVVRLGVGSTVDFARSRAQREVSLNGTAFFAVAHSDVPFVVRVPGGAVSVHGTRFEVRATGADVRVVVVEGTVSLEGTGGAVSLAAGQVGFLTGSAPPRVVDREDVWSLLDWPGGLLIFEATPLRDVAREVQRHFGVPVELGDADLGSRRITAWFGDESLGAVIADVCVVAGAHCGVGGTRVTIGR